MACRRSRSRASIVSAPACAAHWNGVCGFGTNPPIDTLHPMSLRPLASPPAPMTSTARAADSRTDPADRHRAPDVLAAAGLPAGADDLDREVGDLQHVLVGLGRQTAHEVELHLLPAVGVGGGDGADEVVLGHRLVDHPADPLAAALG